VVNVCVPIGTAPHNVELALVFTVFLKRRITVSDVAGSVHVSGIDVSFGVPAVKPVGGETLDGATKVPLVVNVCTVYVLAVVIVPPVPRLLMDAVR